METKVELLEDGRAKYTVTIDANTVDACITKLYKQAAQKYTFPGFRKGKAPRGVIDNALGKEFIAGQATEEIVNEAFPQAVDSMDVYPVGQPDFQDMDAVVSGQDYTFSFVMALRKECELTSYDPIAIEMPPEETTDEEVEFQIKTICEHYATFEDVTRRNKIAEDMRVVMNMKATDDKGEELSTLCTEDFQYTIGSGLFPEEFDKQLIGGKIDSHFEFTMALGETATAYTTPYMGKTENIAFVIDVTGLKKKVAPELTDEWVDENLGFETVDEFRTRVVESLKEQKEEMFPGMREARVLDGIAARVDCEVPEEMAEDMESELMQDFFRMLQNQGMTFDAYLNQVGIDADQFKQDIKQQAADEVKRNLGLDAWARHFELTVSDGEIESEFIKTGQKDWEALLENWKKAGRIHDVREGLLRQKALENAVAGAQITEVSFDK